MNGGPILLDVNVLVALLWAPHKDHDVAQDWLITNRSHGWATCPITALGCARVLSGRAFSMGLVSVSDALQQLSEIVRDPAHVFWPDDLSPANADFVQERMQGPGQLTDRYLLALAAAHDGRLATFDHALAASLPADSPLQAHLEIIPG